MKPLRSAFNVAIDYLAKREYSALELTQKLQSKGFDAQDINKTLADLAAQDLQSDDRFMQMFIRTRFNQGKGEVLIGQQLRQKGIEVVDFSGYDFYQLAQTIRQKKYGQNLPKNSKEKAKQQRFLQSRGFSFDQISSAFCV